MAKTILLDKGHSPLAQGAIGIINEEQYTRIYIDKIAYWINYYKGICVKLPDGPTKDSDLQIPVNAANKYGKNSLYFSVHLNAHADKTANGFELFVNTGSYSGETKALVDSLHRAYKGVVGTSMRDRGIKQASFYVLKYTVMPATLIELGFCTNPNDASVISNQNFINSATQALAKALMTQAGQAIIEPNPPIDIVNLAVGSYVIVSKLNGKVLSQNSDIIAVTNNQLTGDASQIWNWNGSQFTNRASGKVLDVSGNTLNQGDLVIVFANHQGLNQQFNIGSKGQIIAKHSKMVLDIKNANQNNRAEVVQWTAHNGLNQQWIFLEVK